MEIELETATGDAIYRSRSARLPTAFGEFAVTVYRDEEFREHLAVRMGDLDGPPPLVRIHSECLTGDVFGSVRCDCGEQLETALRAISGEGRGLLLYLRQEGRGIGLTNKIHAYALQDQGMDTVEANLQLGFPADVRTYTHAAAMIKDQGVDSVRLLTNNPEKVRTLERFGVRVVERMEDHIPPRAENYAYLQTKVSKMGHLLNLLPPVASTSEQARSSNAYPSRFPEARFPEATETPGDGGVISRLRASLRKAAAGEPGALPSVTLSYAQSIDGSIAADAGKPLQLSNPESQALTHRLRSMHDAVLIGINTLLSDDPLLTVRLVAGESPQPVVLDSHLRFPLEARLLGPPCVPPIIATTDQASAAREERLSAAGAQVVRLPSQANGRVDLHMLLRRLSRLGVRSLMVEGGATVITDFLGHQLVDRTVVTISPRFVGGLTAVRPSLQETPGRLTVTNVQCESFAGDVVLYADVEKRAACARTGRGKRLA
jgi:GTP cyclohydrolase II